MRVRDRMRFCVCLVCADVFVCSVWKRVRVRIVRERSRENLFHAALERKSERVHTHALTGSHSPYAYLCECNYLDC